jgi:lipoyl(octanoyl) transferase
MNTELTDTIIVRYLGRKDYLPCWRAMQTFTQNRDAQTCDEFWLLEHSPVFTQGQNGKPEHVLNPGEIPIIQSDRGGQVTYHGPGQLVIYTLIDLNRKKLNIRQLVSALENSVIQFLQAQQITAHADCTAPGVYIQQIDPATQTTVTKKICSVGLRVKRGCSYHGLALNIAMDLTPFSRINPCGFSQLTMTQVAELVIGENLAATKQIFGLMGAKLVEYLMLNLSYTESLIKWD